MVVEGTNRLIPTVYDHKQSTVVPASVTGNVQHDLTNMDLAMKVHYLRGVYYFKKSDIVDSLTIFHMKQPMFPLLDMYYQLSGRIRIPEEPRSRPFVKCNDCGVRIFEAKCDVTLDEWLNNKEMLSRCQRLVPNKVLGPQLYFSPLTCVQASLHLVPLTDSLPNSYVDVFEFVLSLPVGSHETDAELSLRYSYTYHKYSEFTTFSCGGMAIGFSWSHVMGDPHSAVTYFNKWSEMLQDLKASTRKPNPNKIENNNISASDVAPNSVKEIESLGNTWVLPSNSNMATYSFQITDHKLKQLRSKEGIQLGDFELISALLWQTIAKIRDDKQLNTITVCKNNVSRSKKILANEQCINSVKIDSSPSKLDISELAMALFKHVKNETEMVEAFVEGENSFKDVVVYGSNLTFVDMLDLNLYGLTLKGQNPVNVEYAIDGVEVEGAALIMQGNEKGAKLVALILPEKELLKVKEMLHVSVL